MPNVVLQILGTSDVLVDGKPGRELITGFNLDEMQEIALDIRDELLGNLNRVDFPLIRQAHQYLEESPELVVLLTDQTDWFLAHPATGEGWREIISSDGHWWEEVLLAWAENQGIRCHCVRFRVPPEVESGVADWEGMAKQVTEFFNQFIQNSQIHLPNGQVLSFETLFIQPRMPSRKTARRRTGAPPPPGILPPPCQLPLLNPLVQSANLFTQPLRPHRFRLGIHRPQTGMIPMNHPPPDPIEQLRITRHHHRFQGGDQP